MNAKIVTLCKVAEKWNIIKKLNTVHILHMTLINYDKGNNVAYNLPKMATQVR